MNSCRIYELRKTVNIFKRLIVIQTANPPPPPPNGYLNWHAQQDCAAIFYSMLWYAYQCYNWTTCKFIETSYENVYVQHLKHSKMQLVWLNSSHLGQDGRCLAHDFFQVQATNYYLSQCWPVNRRIYATLGGNELTRNGCTAGAPFTNMV